MGIDRNLAAVITARVVGTVLLIAGFVIPCLGFPSLLNPGAWWRHFELVIFALIITPFVLIPLVLVLLHFPRRRRPPADQVCRACGYDVRAQGPEGTCPECGTAI